MRTEIQTAAEKEKGKIRMKKWIPVLLCLLLVLFAASAAADDTGTVWVLADVDQASARSMLQTVNEHREAEGLAPLTYDYTVEKYALQRAVEIGLSFSYKRPDSTYSPAAYLENLCRGSRTADAAFSIMWNDESCRERILNADANSIGIGHVVYNGTHCWAMLMLKKSTPDTAVTEAITGKRYGVVTLDLSRVGFWFDFRSIYLGDTIDIGEFAVTLDGGDRLPVHTPDTVQWRIAEGSCVELKGTMVKGVSTGSATLQATVFGLVVNVPVSVKLEALSEDVTLEGTSYTYTGYEIRPAVTVKSASGAVLTEKQDYTLKYVNNISAGIGSAKINGIGRYAGSLSLDFEIRPADLAGAKFREIPDVVCTGGKVYPRIIGSYKRNALTGDDYTAEYTNLEVPGDASVTLTGVKNYTGSVTLEYRIVPAKIKASMFLVGTYLPTYNGTPKTPELTGYYFGRKLAEGVDYTLEYKNNVNAGTAAAVVTGRGMLTGTARVRFPIEQASIYYCWVEIPEDQILYPDGSNLRYTVTDDGMLLEKDRDFTAEIIMNGEAGTLKLYGTGNYTGELHISFRLPVGEPATPTPTPTPSKQPTPTPTPTSSKQPTPTPGPDPTPSPEPEPTQDPPTPEPEPAVKVQGGWYLLKESKKTAVFIAPVKNSAAKLNILSTISADGLTYRVTEIADEACSGMNKLKTLYIGWNVSVIGEKAFADCVKLKTVTGGTNVTIIRDGAFRNCKALDAMVLDSSVKKIGKEAFYGCKALKQLTIRTRKLTAGGVGSNAFKKVYSKIVVWCPSSKVKAYTKLLRSRGLGAKAVIR